MASPASARRGMTSGFGRYEKPVSASTACTICCCAADVRAERLTGVATCAEVVRC